MADFKNRDCILSDNKNPIMQVRFTEKYRPKVLKEMCGNQEVIDCLISYGVDDLPNMLFYGPPGTGKTTAAMALSKKFPRQNVLELNASDHRGIETVRIMIKEFSKIKTAGLKMVILDEADSMSKDAQGALRRVIEDSQNTRFCIICNYYKKIIEPIVSRCSKFRFSPVDGILRITEICRKENIEYDQDGILVINRYSDGDMRKILNDVEGVRDSYGKITKENCLEFFGMKSDEVFESVFDMLLKSSFEECKNRIETHEIDCVDFINKISKLLIKSTVIKKMDILKLLGDVEQRLGLGCSDKIQRNAIISAFVLNR